MLVNKGDIRDKKEKENIDNKILIVVVVVVVVVGEKEQQKYDNRLLNMMMGSILLCTYPSTIMWMFLFYKRADQNTSRSLYNECFG